MHSNLLKYCSIGLISLTFLLSTKAFAEKAMGTFTATDQCSAYQSKNKQTNPSNIMVERGKNYPIIDILGKKDPEWYRIKIENAMPKQRWVAAHCGKAHLTEQAASKPSNNKSQQANKCRTSGLADAYVFAVSWQPAFCEIYKHKRECRVKSAESFQAQNFTLHGLWPDKKDCSVNYGFCGLNKMKNFCAYPKLKLDSATRAELNKMMPSAKAGTCLQRHEWYKHGTCQTLFNEDQYYDKALSLLKQFNEKMSSFMVENTGKKISKKAFLAQVDTAFGKGASQRLFLGCRKGNLVDIYMNLPLAVEQHDDLQKLLLQGKITRKTKCPNHFRIDPIGFN